MFENWKFEEKKAKKVKNAIGSNEMNILKIDEERQLGLNKTKINLFVLIELDVCLMEF